MKHDSLRQRKPVVSLLLAVPGEFFGGGSRQRSKRFFITHDEFFYIFRCDKSWRSVPQQQRDRLSPFHTAVVHAPIKVWTIAFVTAFTLSLRPRLAKKSAGNYNRIMFCLHGWFSCHLAPDCRHACAIATDSKPVCCGFRFFSQLRYDVACEMFPTMNTNDEVPQ